MKGILIVLVIVLFTFKVKAQSAEAVQLGLNIEKLAQLKSILSNLKRGYDIIFTGYTTVKSISEGNFNLHKIFLDGLMEVSPTVKKYHKVPAIIDQQIRLVKEYKGAFTLFKQINWFNDGEIAYMGNVYDNLFKSSLRNLDELATVITANKLRMSDDERLDAIDKIYAEMTDKLNFLRYFNNQSKILALQRAKEQSDVNTIKVLYGLK